ncbi:MAG: peptidoglycan DD-metalloendopeptidase family protein [Pyrinomonadaceae bacterium]|nr:peptidoglycan DD-metalloendopeptidase family protein [Pyrinomonadaceae bacterium]
MIIFNLLVISNPAAPQTIAAGASEVGQDIRYTYLAHFSGAGSTLKNAAYFASPVLGLFLKTRSSGKRRKQQQIARVEISPNTAAIREGEEVNLSAVAYTAGGNIVQGVEFEWKAVDMKNSLAPDIAIRENTFRHDTPGAYRVKARAAGVIGEGMIVVREDPDFRAVKELMEQEKEAAEAAAGVVKQRTPRTLRPEVLEAVTRLKAGRSKTIGNSSRMRKADKAALETWEREEKEIRKADRKREQQRREQRIQRKRTIQANLVNNVAKNRKNSKDKSERVREGRKGSGGVQFLNSSYKKKSKKLPANPHESARMKKAETRPSGSVSEKKTAKKAPVRRAQTITGVDANNNAYGTVNGFYYSGGGGGGGGPFMAAASYKKGSKKKSTKNTAVRGSYYAELLLYVDGEMGTGDNIGLSVCSSSSCSWSIAIPTQYHDGQQHTLYAYAVDEIFTMQQTGPTIYNFTIGSAGPDPEWNNDNHETADDPGVQVGTPPNNGTSGAGSGNFGFSAPVASLPGRNGLDVNLSLNYNSLLWHKDGSDIIYDIDKGSPAPGWDIGFGKIMDMDTTGGAMLEGPNGTRHSYDGDIVGSGSNTTYYGRTTDGSFIDYIVSRTASGITSGTAHFPDGTVVTYGAPEDGVIYPTQIKDANGNYITVTYVGNKGPQINTITDTLGRVITFKYASGRLINIQGPGYNGTTQTFVRLHYVQKTLSATFSGLTKGVRDESPYQLKAIYYPVTNTGYWFGDSDSYSSYGMVKKVMMNRSMSSTGTTTAEGTVTKGTMSTQTTYNYPATASNLTSAPQYTTKTETWSGIDTAAAVTSYSVNNTANPRTTTITLPNGTKNKIYSYNTSDWKDGMLDKSEFLSPTNAVLSKQDMTWAQGYNTAPRVTQILSTDEKNQTKKQTFTYGSYYNQVTWAYEYGYTNNLLRKSYTTYQNSATYRGTYSGSKWMSGLHIFSLPLTTEVRNAANVRQSRTNFTYDVGTMTTRSGVSNFDTTYNTSAYTKKRGNVTSTRSYSKASNLTGYIDYDYTYDVLGNNLTTETNCCQQIKSTYTSTYKYAYPTSVRRGAPTGTVDQNTVSATYDFNTGLEKTSTDTNGRVLTSAYDSIGRPTQVTLPTGGKIINEYFPNTLTTKRTGKLSNNTIVSQSTSIANGRGQPQISKLLTGTSTETATKIKYDEMGRQTQVSNPYPATSSPTKWTTYAYDNESRVTQVTAPDGSTNKIFYNETTKPSSALTTAGSTVRSQDAWGRERWARKDDWGRLVEVVEPGPTSNGSVTASGNMVTRYTYDSVDRLTLITQGSQTRSFKYDSLGRMTRQKLAEQTATINDAGNYVGTGGLWSDAFEYDSKSNLIKRTDARGVKTNFNYNSDPLNRLQTITFDKVGADTTNGTIHEAPDITYTYETATGKDKESIKTVVSAGVSTETFTYDLEGRVSNYKMSLTGRTSYPLETSYLYDTANRLTEVRYPAQYGMSGNTRKEVNVTYDQTSRLKDLKVDNVAQMDQISYNDFGQATSIRIGGGASNPMTEQYTFDANTGLMTNQKVKKGATTKMDLSYYYARDLSKGSLNGTTGNLTKVVNNLDRNKDRKYEFDTLGRLIKAKGGVAAGGSGVANWTQTYTYDRYGNKLTSVKSGITANSAAIPLDGVANQAFAAATNRITTASHEYDNAGNMTRGKAPDGSIQKFEYDEAGRIIHIKTDSGTILETNTYASSRERLKKEAGTTRTYYAWGGSSVLAEHVETASETTMKWSKSYIYAGSRLLSTATKNGSSETVEYHHPDRLGTKMVSDPVANTTKEQATLPFGTEIPAETQATTNQRFTSYDRSGATGLDYAVNRTYNSGQSRFTQVDPIGMGDTSLSNPQSMNLYGYVRNNPVDLVDPSGLNLAAGCYVFVAGVIYDDGRIVITDLIFFCIGGGGGSGGGRGSGEPGGGGRGASPKQDDENCGLNPVTKKPGILNDNPSKKHPRKNGTPGREGKFGNIRAGNGGNGGFGERKHTGIDITAPVGTPIYASRDGIVRRAKEATGSTRTRRQRRSASQNYGWGGVVGINYDGVALNGAYAHLSKVVVKEGDKVTAGQLIGFSGRTGNADNPGQPPGDDHLHYGVFTGEYNGGGFAGVDWKDPRELLNSPCPKPKK